MESPQTITPVVVAMGTRVCGITFVNREPCLIWNKDILWDLIQKLHLAYQQWDAIDRQEAKEKENANKA